MPKINRYTEDQARDAGFTDAQITASRTHNDGFIGNDKEGKMSFNIQAEIAMGGPEATGRGAVGHIPEGFAPRR